MNIIKIEIVWNYLNVINNNNNNVDDVNGDGKC